MKRTLVVAALTLFAGAASALESSLDKALSSFRAGDFKAVTEIAAEVPAGDAERPKVLYLAGEAQLVLGDWQNAERSFLAVLDARPEAVPAYVGLGRALTRMEAYEDAELHLSAALELDPKDSGARRAMGALLVRTERAKEGLKLLAAAFKADPKSQANARAYVEGLLLAGEDEKAEGVAERVVRSQPKSAMGPFLLGVVQERRGRDVDAIASYQRAIELDGKFLDAHKNLAILCHTLSDTYQIQERNDLALKHYALYFELGGVDEELKKTYGQLKSFLEQRG